jgi:hypothetical protein
VRRQISVARKHLCLTIIAAIAGPAFAAPSPADVRTSAKAADPLVRCFAATQDRASAAWSFVPKESGGGTFSNAGAPNVRAPYYVDVADRGATRVIRVEAATGDAAARTRLLSAIDSCI